MLCPRSGRRKVRLCRPGGSAAIALSLAASVSFAAAPENPPASESSVKSQSETPPEPATDTSTASGTAAVPTHPTDVAPDAASDVAVDNPADDLLDIAPDPGGPTSPAASDPEPLGEALPTVTPRAPWPIEVAPGGGDALLHGKSLRYFFGLNPGNYSESGGLESGSTGFSNIAGGFQAGFLGFAGGSWDMYTVGRTETLRLAASGSLSMGYQIDATDDGTGSATSTDTRTGYTASLTIDSASGEYLRYVHEMDGVPIFAGAWGNMSGISLNASRPTSSGSVRSTTAALPARLSVGVGAGRLYPIHWLLIVKRMEAVLLEEGALTGAIPHDVADQILSKWYADRAHFMVPADPQNPYGTSHHRQMLAALQLLSEAALLKKPVHVLSAYRLERILTDANHVDRWHGRELRLGLRIGAGLQRNWVSGSPSTNTDPATSLAIELIGRQVYNLSLVSDLRIEPSVAVAPRTADSASNTLAGTRRVALDQAPQIGGGSVFLPTGRFVADVPVVFTRYIYDPSLNLSGLVRAHMGASFGYATPVGGTSDAVAAALSAGVAYTLFSDNSTGYTLGLNGGLGYFDQLVYQVGLVAVVGFGEGDLFYSAPDQVGDTVPFDASWLPYPKDLGL